ncbi:hypothetical protein FRC10_004494 [Ceratobasidium sp. 414]|nr:hypothetical protein FRC10_004494 [Ceratobasidium sp. 414]
MVEEVDDEDEPSKKKKKGKKKKTSKCTMVPELGVELDNLKCPGKEAEDRRACRRSSGKFDQLRVEQTPPGFQSGGYLELMHGDMNRAGRRKSAGCAQPPGSDAQRPQARGHREGAEGARNRAGRSQPSEPSDGSNNGTYQDNSESEELSETDRGNRSDRSDSSSSEEDEAHKLKWRIKRMREKQKKLEKRLTAQARSGYKAQAPKSYNGDADFDKFELFVFNYDNWCIDTQLSTHKHVRNVSRFLDGKASVWYMSNVALNINTYDMKQIYQGIFDYCFPPDFKENLRCKYMRKQQGDQSIQDYFAKLELMRHRLKITENQHAHRAYDGAARYIKGEWAIKGILPEDTTIEELLTTAIDIERAHKIRKLIKQPKFHKPRRDRSHSLGRRDNRRFDCVRPEKGRFQRHDNRRGESKEDNKPNKEASKDAHGREWSENWWSKPAMSNPRAAKTAKQRDEYRALNKCFECAETGHLVKDCPSRNKARPSRISANTTNLKAEGKVRASSVLLKELDRLTGLRDSIEVSAAQIEVSAASKPKDSNKPTEQRLVE